MHTHTNKQTHTHTFCSPEQGTRGVVVLPSQAFAPPVAMQQSPVAMQQSPVAMQQAMQQAYVGQPMAAISQPMGIQGGETFVEQPSQASETFGR
jgi:hypothetical protein